MIWVLAAVVLGLILGLLLHLCWKCHSLNTYARSVGSGWFVRCYSCGHDTWDDFCKAHHIYNGI